MSRLTGRMDIGGYLGAKDDPRRCGDSRAPFYGLAEDFDLTYVGPATGAVPAAWQQIGEADFVDLAQVGIIHPIHAGGDDFGDVEVFTPAHIGDREFQLSCQSVVDPSAWSPTSQVPSASFAIGWT